MGAVVLAWDERLDRPVAVKMLLGDHPDLTRRFEHEARALASLQHPNIVRVYSHGLAQKGPYLLMEYLDGRPLSQPPPDLDPVAVMLELAGALDFLHSRQVVHRDVKSANVLLTRDRRPVLVDFGLAVAPDLSRFTREGSPLGTLGYMSPESLAERRFDEANDWWGWAVTLFELCEGRLPFKLEDLVRIPSGGTLPGLEFTRTDPESPVGRLLADALGPFVEERPRGLEPIRSRLGGLGPGTVTVAGLAPAREPAGVHDASGDAAPGGRRSGANPRIASAAHPTQGAGSRGGLPLVAGLAALVGALGLLAGRPVPRPSDSPAVAAPSTPGHPLGAPFQDALRAGLANRPACGTPQPPDCDPYDSVVASDRLAGLVELQPFDAWLDQGGRVEEVPGEVAESLRRIDAELAAGGLPRIFTPLLDLGGEIAGRTGGPGSPGGSWEAALTRLGTALDRDEAEFEESGLIESLPGTREAGWAVGGDPGLWKNLRLLSFTAQYRLAMRPHLEKSSELLAAYLHAVVRAMRDSDPAGSVPLAVSAMSRLRRSRHGLWGPLATARGDRLLAGLPPGPAGQLIRARLWEWIADSRDYQKLDPEPARAGCLAGLAACLAGLEAGELPAGPARIVLIEAAPAHVLRIRNWRGPIPALEAYSRLAPRLLGGSEPEIADLVALVAELWTAHFDPGRIRASPVERLALGLTLGWLDAAGGAAARTSGRDRPTRETVSALRALLAEAGTSPEGGP